MESVKIISSSPLLHSFGGGVAHNRVAREGAHGLCSVGDQEVGGLCDGSSGVHYIVDEYHVLVSDVSDHGHFLHHVCLGSCLVAEHERNIEVLGVGVGAFCSADIGRGDDHILQTKALDVGNENR